MTGAAGDTVEAASPEDSWHDLRGSAEALLIDVRTQPEWAFVGVPDLSAAAAEAAFIEWTRFPAMAPNPTFLGELDQAVSQTDARRLYFICRSGGRSHAAAVAALDHFGRAGRSLRCINVLEGFEGDLDADGHRGVAGGWKARGLPWRQG